jgi:pimeloyl-ACP methyl ester carboxylesterase
MFANNAVFAQGTLPSGCRNCCPPGTVFVANPCGEETECLTQKFRKIFERNAIPYRLVSLGWKSDDGTIADYKDAMRNRLIGPQLAAQVCQCRRTCPECKIFLVGYGAGAAIALATADALPPGTVDRIILLGPAVPCSYDLCQALRASREGIDVFFESTCGVGKSGQRGVAAAGRVGFSRPGCPEASRLRQYGWSTKWDPMGHHGGHLGYKNHKFLQLNVVPLFRGDAPVVALVR